MRTSSTTHQTKHQSRHLTEYQRAFSAWAVLLPRNQTGNCCFSDHYMTNGEGKRVPQPDAVVCPRERAWRNYIRLRDGIH